MGVERHVGYDATDRRNTIKLSPGSNFDCGRLGPPGMDPNTRLHLTAGPGESWVAQVMEAQPQVKLAVSPIATLPNRCGFDERTFHRYSKMDF
jgi:hypothetical protein